MTAKQCRIGVSLEPIVPHGRTVERRAWFLPSEVAAVLDDDPQTTLIVLKNGHTIRCHDNAESLLIRLEGGLIDDGERPWQPPPGERPAR